MPPTPPMLDEDAVLTLANLVHMMLAEHQKRILSWISQPISLESSRETA